MVAGYGFPFRPIGPPSDYYGMVSPYMMALCEFDEVILSGQVPTVERVLDGSNPSSVPLGLTPTVPQTARPRSPPNPEVDGRRPTLADRVQSFVPGIDEIAASEVSSMDATDAAFCSATRTTLVGSMTPASTRSS